MGSGDWIKTIISRKKTKQGHSKPGKGSSSAQSNGAQRRNHSHKVSNALCNGASSEHSGNSGSSIEEIAAIRIQNAFRVFRARKTLRHLKGLQRLKVLNQGHSVKNQTSTTLSYLQSWSKIQSQIKARRACMVTEGRIRQKKQENQLKLEAKLHDLEVEWCGGSGTMDEILTKLQQREEAAGKRERALAYAFSHQWRANSGLNQGQFSYEFGKGSWGWSWMERWIAARPWETRVHIQPASPIQTQTKAPSKAGKNTNTSAQKIAGSTKSAAAIGKVSAKRTTLQLDDEKVDFQQPNPKTANQSNPKPKTKQEKQHSLPKASEVST